MNARVRELLGNVIDPNDVAGAIGRAFDRMGIAEEEIEAAKKKWPDKKAEIHAAFGALAPGELSRYGSDRLYRAHARELLERVAKGERLELGTDAECLAALSLASLKAPLASGHVAAMEKAFASVFPKNALGPNVGRESYPGNVDEILTEIRKKIASRRRA